MFENEDNTDDADENEFDKINMEKNTENIISVIQNIPAGKVINYGKIAGLAGMPNGARQVVRVLHSMTEKYFLPWHRVVGKDGTLRLGSAAAEEQKRLLENEGVVFNGDKIDEKFFWDVKSMSEIKQ